MHSVSACCSLHSVARVAREPSRVNNQRVFTTKPVDDVVQGHSQKYSRLYSVLSCIFGVMINIVVLISSEVLG